VLYCVMGCASGTASYLPGPVYTHRPPHYMHLGVCACGTASYLPHIQLRLRLNVCLCLPTPADMQGRVRAGAWVHVWVCRSLSGSGCGSVWEAGMRVVGSDSGAHRGPSVLTLYAHTQIRTCAYVLHTIYPFTNVNVRACIYMHTHTCIHTSYTHRQ
jgi:hypothetical protein